jgi:meso-butanediol dehydrogenase/(S,S)-butanediol dehydrogenase/diacetyl reductase
MTNGVGVLEGEIAVVTGAARGIGAAVAAALIDSGASVVGVDVGVPTGESIAGGPSGQYAQFREVDVADREAIHCAFADVASELGPVTVLVNCAGVICDNRPAEEVDEADLDRLWQVNVKGSLFCAQAAVVNGMITRRHGRIVNFASQAALAALPHQSAYTATKGAVTALTRSLAVDWGRHGITVNAIAPTFIWTPMSTPMLKVDAMRQAAERRIPLGRLGQPSDIAGVVVFLASSAAGYITGQTVAVDGGWTAGEPELEL